MIRIKDFLSRWFNRLDDQHLYEMATIHRNVMLGNEKRSVQIHGANSKDRENPHIHIYDIKTKTNFNFEISLVDLICYDELVIIRMLDRDKHIDIRNRSKCSWDGYKKLKQDFEEWLESDNRTLKGDFLDNLDALIYSYNNESIGEEDNPFLKYLSDRGLKVHNNYKYLFTSEEIEKYGC